MMHNMIIQCPDTQKERNSMFETMYGVEYPDLYLVRELHVILPVLLSKEVENPRGGGHLGI